MAFSNLFTNLCALEGSVNDRRNDINSRQETEKRKVQSMQTGPYVKRRRLQSCAAGVSDAVRSVEPKAPEVSRFNCNNPQPGISRDGSYRHNERTFPSNDHYRGNTNKTKKKKKNKGKKKRERENAQIYKNVHRDQRSRNQDNTQPHKPYMSQEFKDQHSLEVDGRLLCIYFLRGRCIKGEECQFEHVEGYNGLIKESCKFYIQGFCLKGKNCPYLHETFPCKFFHTKGICRRDQCMFSHEPLTDITRKLLDNFIQWENEVRKKAEEKTENVSESVEENTTVEIVVPTARPSFYQSSAVEADALMPDEEQPAEEDNAPQTQDDEEPEDSFPFALEQPEPVCYSVEAMLGPKLFKPCLYTAPKEASLSESKTTSDSPLNVIDSPYSVANAMEFSTTSSLLPSPSTAPAILATCGSNDKETSLILNVKCSVSPNTRENTFKKPSSFYDSAASGYHTKEKSSCGTLKENRQLTIESCAPNSMLKDEKITAEYKREYVPLMRNHSLSQTYIPLMGSNYQSPPVQNYKIDRGESYFKDKPAQSLKNEIVLNKCLPTNQVTSAEQNLKETNRETSLTNVDRITRVPVNSIFSSLTPDVDPTFIVRSSVCGNTDIQSALKSESDCSASQKVNSNEAKMQIRFNLNTSESTKGCSSKSKREEIERDASHPVKKCHGLFESLTPGSNQTSTVCNSFRDKPPGPSTPKHGTSICASEKISCGSNQATKTSVFTGNTSQNSNSSKKLVSISETDNSKDSKKEEDIQSSTKSFQSLFTSFTPDLDQTSTGYNSFSDKAVVPSAPKVEKSICDSQSIKCETLNKNGQKFVSSTATSDLKSKNLQEDVESVETPRKSLLCLFASLTPDSDRASATPSEKCAGEKKAPYKALTPNQTTRNTSGSTTNSNRSNHSEKLVTMNLQGSKKEEDIESAKSFQSLFTSLPPDTSTTSTISNSFSDNPTVPNVQKVEKKVARHSNQARKGSVISSSSNSKTFRATGTETFCKNGQKFVSVSGMSDLKSTNQKVNDETVETPVESFQSIFGSLTATFNKSVKPDVLSVDYVEKFICDGQKDNFDSNQVKFTTKQSQFTKKSLSEIINNGSSRSHGEGTKTLSNNDQKLVSPSAMSNLKSKNKKNDTDDEKTPPVKPFQSLFTNLTPEMDQTSTFNLQRDEKSICDSQMFKCNSSQSTKQSQFNESTTGSREENRNIGIAYTKSSLNLFSAPLSESAVTNNSEMPCLPEPPHFLDDKLSNAKRTSSPAENAENKLTEENKYGPKKNSATVNSPKVSNKSHASPPLQPNNGPTNSILKSLFQQLRPYEQQEPHHICGKSNTHPG